MQGRRLDTTRFLDDRSEVKTSSASHFLPFYEKHTDPILGTVKCWRGNLQKSHADFQKTEKSSGSVMVIG